MSMAAVHLPRGAIGKADLLRLIALRDCDRLLVMQTANADYSLAYVRLAAEDPPPPPRLPLDDISLPQLANPAPAQPRRSLQMPYVYGVVADQLSQQPMKQVATTWETGPTLDESDAEPRCKERRVQFEDLVPSARLLPLLQRVLSTDYAGTVDVRELTRCFAMNLLPPRLPRLRRRRWSPGLVVVLEFSQRLWPYREDMHRLAERLLQRCGPMDISLRIFNEGPRGGWYDWQSEQHDATRGRLREWQMLPRATPVLIASDLGLLLGVESETAQEWVRFIHGLLAGGARPVVLAPLCAEQLPSEFASCVPVFRWSPDAPLVRARGMQDATRLPRQEVLDQLLAMIAVTRRVDPPLLRALRQLLPGTPTDASLEGAAWCHENVESGTAVWVRPDRAKSYLKLFASDPQLITLHLELNSLRVQHHAHLRRALEHEEVLQWNAHASSNARVRVKLEQDRAIDFMGKLARTLRNASAPARWRHVAEGIVQRARRDTAMTKEFGDVLWPLEQLVGSRVGVVDEAASSGVVLDIAAGTLQLRHLPGSDDQYLISKPLSLRRWGALITNEPASGVGVTTLVASDELPCILSDTGCRHLIRIETSHECVTLVPIERPRGIECWECTEAGLRVQGPWLCGNAFILNLQWDALPLTLDAASANSRPRWYFRWDAPAPAMPGQPVFGLDAYGLYMDLLIQGRHGNAVQRFRRIEAGKFLMGSPPNEGGRRADEGPQHQVTLSRGIWLADAACTQRLWRALIGRNPSHFKGDVELPVEKVSWNDIQVFLRRLQGRLRGCEVSLPTEAEWEYACRAGVDAPFNSGETIPPDQVNYDGNYPYRSGKRGEYRQRTVPVRSLAANDWGLYQMHGNVDEWCLDGFREYGREPMLDPTGSMEEGTRRAIRGGSWRAFAASARSAYRRHREPDHRALNLGFRLCLRSIEPRETSSCRTVPAPGVGREI